MCGYLEKRGGNLKTWKNRFCILKLSSQQPNQNQTEDEGENEVEGDEDGGGEGGEGEDGKGKGESEGGGDVGDELRFSYYESPSSYHHNPLDFKGNFHVISGQKLVISTSHPHLIHISSISSTSHPHLIHIPSHHIHISSTSHPHLIHTSSTSHPHLIHIPSHHIHIPSHHIHIDSLHSSPPHIRPPLLSFLGGYGGGKGNGPQVMR